MSGIARASVLIGAGTIVSRVTGLLRTIVLVAAVGAIGFAGDAFAVANQLPNNIYVIISTGLLTAVIVPQIVKVSAHADGGQAFISKLLTLGTVVLIVTTGLAIAVAPWLVAIYAPDFTPDQLALATAFAYWCLPQIFFYGVFALLGEILNARRVFGPYTWAPIVNNLVSITGFTLFIVIFGPDQTQVEDWTPEMIALLAGTATLGIVIQTVVLLLFWRRAGLHLRPDFRWRGVGLNQLGRLAGWTFLMVIAGQLAGWIQSRVLSGASGEAAANLVVAERLAHLHAPVLDHRALDRDAVLHPAERARACGARRRSPRRHRPQHPHPRLVHRDRDGRAHGGRDPRLAHLHRLGRRRPSMPRWC